MKRFKLIHHVLELKKQPPVRAVFFVLKDYILMQQKNNREYMTSFKFPDGVDAGKFSFDKATGEITFFDCDGQIIVTSGLTREHYYEGKNRRVTLSKLISGEKHPLLGMDDTYFLATYDCIYIVDTNEIILDSGEKHNITSFLRCTIKDIGQSHLAKIYERVGYFHFVNLINCVPEKAGWVNLIEQNFFKKDLRKGQNIAIVTDHDLINLESYNAGSKAILDDYYLPEKVKLMYAKADKKDTITNRLIRASDTLANIYKTEKLSETIKLPKQECKHFECDSYWFVNEKRQGLGFSELLLPKPQMVYGENPAVKACFYDHYGACIEKIDLLKR